MDIKLYRQYLNEYVQQAINESDGKVSRITELLYEKQVKGLMVAHREEKLRALSDAQYAFSEHRHWPLEIIISHLGVEIDLPG
jgi:hypothetical protein